MKKYWSCVRPFELVVDQELLPRIEALLWYKSFVYVLFGVHWIYIPSWGRKRMRFNFAIIDLESLQLSIIWWRTSNWGTLNEVSIACSIKYRVYCNSDLILVHFCFIRCDLFCSMRGKEAVKYFQTALGKKMYFFVFSSWVRQLNTCMTSDCHSSYPECSSYSSPCGL